MWLFQQTITYYSFDLHRLVNSIPTRHFSPDLSLMLATAKMYHYSLVVNQAIVVNKVGPTLDEQVRKL